MIGKTLAHYQILSKLGEGGMGEVYRARDTRLDRDIALKVIAPQFMTSPDRVARFQQEACLLAALNHPNIVTIHSVECDSGSHFLTMEFVEGQTLEEIRQPNGIAFERVLDLAIAISAALTAAHENSVVHRDLKPGNVMMGRDGRVRVVDFGIAKLLSDAVPNDVASSESATAVRPLTSRGEISGTLAYMSPEQITGDVVDTRTDIFSFGVLLFEMAVGRRPFEGRSTAEIAAAILTAPAPSLRELRKDLPWDFGRILTRCLQKAPVRRFQTARDLQTELEDLRDSLGSTDDSQSLSRARSVAAELAEREFVFTAPLVRKLEQPNPAMLGDHLDYLDNEVESDVLVLLLHGLGSDGRTFSSSLKRLPHRVLAPTIYGWSHDAQLRPALNVADQSVLLEAFIEDRVQALQPRRCILAGHSCGADHIMHMVLDRSRIKELVDGILLLGINLTWDSCFVSGIFCDFDPANPEDTIQRIMNLDSSSGDLVNWVRLHRYLVSIFSKFGRDFSCLQPYATDIAEPYRVYDPQHFPRWYRAAMESFSAARFVFTVEDFEAVDTILRHHLEHDSLGDSYRPETLIRENIGHSDLAEADWLVQHVLALIDELEGSTD